MKMFLLIVNLIICNLNDTRSQNTIDYDFLNSAIKLIKKDIGRDSIKLVNEIHFLSFKENKFEYYRNELGEIINEETLREILNCSISHTEKMKFNQNEFKSVRLIDRRVERRMKRRYDHNIKLAKSKWEDFYQIDTLNDEEKLKFHFTDSIKRKSYMEFDFKTTNDDYIYMITLPCMDSKKEFAFIDFGGGRIRSKLSGYVYVFRRIEGKWIIVKRTNSWAV